MGYYTRYELTVSDNNVDEHVQGIERVSGYAGLFGERVKWYDHEKDMRAYSKDHPEVLFELKGEGEEGGDLWKAYFKGGMMQKIKPKITFDDFDESKLC